MDVGTFSGTFVACMSYMQADAKTSHWTLVIDSVDLLLHFILLLFFAACGYNKLHDDE